MHGLLQSGWRVGPQAGCIVEYSRLIPLISSWDVTTFLDHLRILVNVLAARDITAHAHVFNVEDPAVLMAAVSKSKVETRAVLGGGPQ